jgi:hypothetical protein
LSFASPLERWQVFPARQILMFEAFQLRKTVLKSQTMVTLFTAMATPIKRLLMESWNLM